MVQADGCFLRRWHAPTGYAEEPFAGFAPSGLV